MVLEVVNRKDTFLNALKESTRETYRIGLAKCEAFFRTLPEYEGYADPLFEFLVRVQNDRRRDVLAMEHEDRRVIKALFEYLSKQGGANKSLLVYVAALQSYGKYYGVAVSTEYTNPPNSTAVNEKHEWTLKELGKFIESMEHPQYQSLSTTLLQSTLRLSDVLGKKLPYGRIQEEFESGKTPVCIPILDSQKTGVRHRTFLGSLAIKKMKTYFEKKGTPGSEDPIFDMSDRSVDEYFARTAKKLFGSWSGSQCPYSPHSLRAASSTFLSDALMPETGIEYFSGHEIDSDVKLRYRKRSTDRWRSFYKQFEWALDYTVKPEDAPKTSVAEIKRLIESMQDEDG